MNKLQLDQNSAVRIIISHTTPVPPQLHWLPVKNRMISKRLLIFSSDTSSIQLILSLWGPRPAALKTQAFRDTYTLELVWSMLYIPCIYCIPVSVSVFYCSHFVQ